MEPSQAKGSKKGDVHPSVEENVKENEERHPDAPDEVTVQHEQAAHDGDARTPAEISEAQEQAQSVAGALGDLSRRELVRLSSFIASALENNGEDSEVKGAGARYQDLREEAGAKPINKSATEDLDRAKVAKKADLDEDQVLDWAVRSDASKDGKLVGDSYLTVVTTEGKKEVVKL
jgi:hypothetical protein